VSSAPASTVQDISASSSAASTAQTASSAAAPNTTESGSTAAVSDEKESDSGAAATTSDASSSADSVSEVSDSASELSPLEAQFAIPARRIHKESELYRKLISHMPRGIPNSGSDCFIGSLFQVIVVGDSRFQEELINIPAVQEVLGNYSSNKGLSMRPLREVLQYIQMQREDKGDRSWLVGQHDPHDALMLFMSCLSKDSPLLQHLRIRREYVKLDGYLKPQISTKYEENWGVLTIPFMHNKENRICSTRNDGRVYFEDLLAHYLKRNGVAGEEARFDLLSENGMDALRGVNVPLATESTQFEFPPSSLVVSLSRFAYNGKLLLNTEKGQINIPVQTPEKFALNSDCFEGGYSAEYELSGFITHEGLRVNSGHYFGCVSRVDSEGKKRYFSFNDSRVAEINRDHFLFLAQSAYIFHFKMSAIAPPGNLD
ncbi:MAG: ubiquitin carboxyl-terminal hydrolase, partial [Verrucomicrobia bacterium]|nr:ubiquitin carboxyl-terminal hydrolase [Verrucomicrobiota bacterium]